MTVCTSIKYYILKYRSSTDHHISENLLFTRISFKLNHTQILHTIIDQTRVHYLKETQEEVQNR